MRVAIISDIHSNLEALEAVLEKIKGVDEIVCLGDIVGYGSDPNECIRLVKEHNMKCVMGNHDLATITGDVEWFNPHAARAILWTRRVISDENRKFLSTLGKKMKLDLGFQTLAVHGSPMDPIWEYVMDDHAARECFDAAGERLILLGHTHIACSFVLDEMIAVNTYQHGGELKLDRRAILNPGAVGQPRDYNPQASFAILEEDRITVHRIDYDVQKASQKILNAQLPSFLAQRLLVGI